MAAAELSRRRRARRRWLPANVRRTWLCAYTGVWATTLTSTAVVGLVGRPLATPTRCLLGLTLSAQRNPPPQLGHIMALATHNIPIASWPLLLGVLGAHRHRFSKHLADGLVVACIILNTLPVGAALGAYGTVVLPYVPQLPFEWAGLALGAGAWITQRNRHGVTPTGERVATLAMIVIAMTCAAVLETFTVPHR